MSCTRVAVILGIVSFQVVASPPHAEDVVMCEDILVQHAISGVVGFTPHVEPTRDGRIDWTGGFIITDGRGIAEATDDQGQLMAKRGATIVAARNALAIAEGINVDASGRVGDMHNGRVIIEGVIKGHEVVEVKWRPDLNPPEMRVKLRVPLWGLRSLSSVFYDVHRHHVVRSGARRVPLIVDQVDVSDCVLVIDARGTGLDASLFPTVVTDNGDLLYDVGRLSRETAKRRAPAQYVESDMTYEQLRARVENEDQVPNRPGMKRARLASYDGPAAPAREVSKEATSQPSSQPAKESRRRARRRLVVKAAAASGDRKTRIVVTREDAEKLRRSAEGSNLLREGQVVIVVDSAAAGIQGRRHPRLEDTQVAARPASP